MRTLIFSDIHDNLANLERLLAMRESLAVQRAICLGDVGNHPVIFQLLAEEGIPCTFGNWEVSGLRRMSADLAASVGAWPTVIRRGNALFCHATPDVDPVWTDTATTAADMAKRKLGWHRVFPRMDRNEEARWSAFAALEEADARVVFHGHTHVQGAWAWLPDGDGRRHMRPIAPQDAVTEIRLESGISGAPARYIVGVGSIGAPDDGPWPRFVLYDDEAQVVTLHRMGR